MIHLKCLRHFLKNIQTNIYSFHAKELIECCTKFEFEFTSKRMSNIFHNAIQKERENKRGGIMLTVNHESNIKEVLDKIGLKYDFSQNFICVSDLS